MTAKTEDAKSIDVRFVVDTANGDSRWAKHGDSLWARQFAVVCGKLLGDLRGAWVFVRIDGFTLRWQCAGLPLGGC